MLIDTDLQELEHSILTGVTVGVGSVVLLFSSGPRILVQCPFKCECKENSLWGHGEDISTSSLLFPFLNLKVEECNFFDAEILSISFGNEQKLVIYPERNGLESYVITTSHGDWPVIAS